MTKRFRSYTGHSSDYDAPTAAEQKLMFSKYKRTKRISDRQPIIKRNMPMVIDLAGKMYKRIYNQSVIEFEDLVAHGVLGLIDAIEKYNSKKSSFITYAYHHVMRHIRTAIFKHNNMIHIPRDYYVAKKNRKYVNDPIKMMKNISFIEGMCSKDNFNEHFDKKDTIARLRRLINEHFDEKERDILVRRYGLSGEKPATFATISRKYKVSKQRIFQIEREMLDFLKKNLEK